MWSCAAHLRSKKDPRHIHNCAGHHSVFVVPWSVGRRAEFNSERDCSSTPTLSHHIYACRYHCFVLLVSVGRRAGFDPERGCSSISGPIAVRETPERVWVCHHHILSNLKLSRLVELTGSHGDPSHQHINHHGDPSRQGISHRFV